MLVYYAGFYNQKVVSFSILRTRHTTPKSGANVLLFFGLCKLNCNYNGDTAIFCLTGKLLRRYTNNKVTPSNPRILDTSSSLGDF